MVAVAALPPGPALFISSFPVFGHTLFLLGLILKFEFGSEEIGQLSSADSTAKFVLVLHLYSTLCTRQR